jgi:hypothetical protein
VSPLHGSHLVFIPLASASQQQPFHPICVIRKTCETKFHVSPKFPKYIREESSVKTLLAQIAEITVTIPRDIEQDQILSPQG